MENKKLLVSFENKLDQIITFRETSKDVALYKKDNTPNIENIKKVKNVLEVSKFVEQKYKEKLDEIKDIRFKKEEIQKVLKEIEDNVKNNYQKQQEEKITVEIEVAGIKTTKKEEKQTIKGFSIRETKKIEWPDVSELPETFDIEGKPVLIKKKEIDKSKIKKIAKDIPTIYESLGLNVSTKKSVSFSLEKMEY